MMQFNKCHCTLTAVYFTTVSFICSKCQAIEGNERERQTKMAGDLFTREPDVRGQHRRVRCRTCMQRVKVPWTHLSGLYYSFLRKVYFYKICLNPFIISHVQKIKYDVYYRYTVRCFQCIFRYITGVAIMNDNAL